MGQRWRAWGSAAGLGLAAASLAQQFTSDEVLAIRSLWSRPDAYEVDVPPESLQTGLWQVRQTVAGSQWLWAYNRLRGAGKTPPLESAPRPTVEQLAAWEAWVAARYAWDRFRGATRATELSASVLPGYRPAPPAPAADPGPAPKEMVAALGNPPAFHEAVIPLAHTIRFEDGTEARFQDNTRLSARNAYYRFEKGVMAVGKRVRDWPAAELERLFAEAGIGATERAVMSAVSLLEGGFEAVNTYDTGYVSIGFIQFASLREGGGSLGRMLLRYKTAQPEAFQSDFRRFGLDVTREGKLCALDLESGAELTGAEANARIIEDKRLAAVFYRAGLASPGFRSAQVRSAYLDYYPAADGVSFNAGGKTIALKVRDFIRSEAGMATLMDRKVNTGTLDPLPFVLQVLAAERGLATADQFAQYERTIVAGLKYRKDYLADRTLSQPPAPPPASRKGGRAGRKRSTGGR